MNLESVLVVSAVMFSIGLLGVLWKRSMVAVIMSLELLFIAVIIAAVGFTRFTPAFSVSENLGTLEVDKLHLTLTGQVLAIFVVVVTAVETAIGLALMFALYRTYRSVEISDAAGLKK